MVNNKSSKTIKAFQTLYYNIVPRTQTWCGVPIQKCPTDLWVYHEIIFETQPEYIIETGIWCGGSALFMAIICDLANKGEILTIDINPHPDLPAHSRIRYLKGSSIDPQIVSSIREIVGNKRAMVILDSDHTENHVSHELEIYSEIVSQGCYLIVEDTNTIDPRAAVDKFLAKRDDFVQDPLREKFLLTFNPGGYLKKAW